MHIRNIDSFPLPGAIALHGWDEVERGITDFATSRTPQAYNDLFKSEYIPGQLLTSQQFLDTLLSEAKEGLERYGSWREYYDYANGEGPFLKRSVALSLLDGTSDLYGLTISEANNDALATHCGRERVWTAYAVLLHTDPVDDIYALFDFDVIAKQLHDVFPLCTPIGSEMLTKMIRWDSLMSYVCPHHAYGQDYSVEVEVTHVKTAQRWSYPNQAGEKPEIEGEWIIQGAMLRTLRNLSNYSSQPGIVIRISQGAPLDEQLARHIPALNPLEKKRLQQVAQTIQALFQDDGQVSIQQNIGLTAEATGVRDDLPA